MGSVLRQAVCLLSVLCLMGCSGVSREVRETGVVPPNLNTKIFSHTMQVEAAVAEKYRVDYTSPEAVSLQAVLDQLQAHALRPYVGSRIGIIMQPGYANSCTGGQNVFIGKTLLAAMDDEMIAFVLAHELAHIDKLHPWRKYKGAQKKRWCTLGIGSLASIGASLFTPSSPTAAVAVSLAPSGVRFANEVTSDIVHKGYQRQYEYEADRCAAHMLEEAGYDPYAGVRALERLSELKKNPRWLEGSEIFSTHPMPEKRSRRLAESLAARSPV